MDVMVLRHRLPSAEQCPVEVKDIAELSEQETQDRSVLAPGMRDEVNDRLPRRAGTPTWQDPLVQDFLT
jgi:hypothetical protein